MIVAGLFKTIRQRRILEACGVERCAPMRGKRITAGADILAIHDNHEALRISIWDEILSRVKPKLAFTYAFSDSDTVRMWLESAVSIRERVEIVPVLSADEALAACDEFDRVAVRIWRTRPFDWSLYKGRKVWLFLGGHRSQWMMFCEALVRGVEVEGVVLSREWSETALRHQKVALNSLKVVGDDRGSRARLEELSCQNLSSHWAVVASSDTTRRSGRRVPVITPPARALLSDGGESILAPSEDDFSILDASTSP